MEKREKEWLMSEICACSAPLTLRLRLRYAQGERSRVCIRTDSVHEPKSFAILQLQPLRFVGILVVLTLDSQTLDSRLPSVL
jgi:hypothetical protein